MVAEQAQGVLTIWGELEERVRILCHELVITSLDILALFLKINFTDMGTNHQGGQPYFSMHMISQSMAQSRSMGSMEGHLV